jgi:sugar lactone lactonase YvrE
MAPRLTLFACVVALTLPGCSAENAPLEKMGLTLIAGNGSPGAADGRGAEARFNQPMGVAVGPDGNLYVADTYNGLVRKITPDGTVSVYAGSDWGFHDAPALDADFKAIDGICVDAAGTVFVADWETHSIRKITTAGMTNLIAGTGHAGSADGPNVTAEFRSPTGVAVAVDGSLYVADTGNHKIRVITPTPGGEDWEWDVSTVAGSGVAGDADGRGLDATFNQPVDIAAAPDGSFYVSEDAGNRIRKLSRGADGAWNVTTVAGNGRTGLTDGPGGAASFNRVFGVAVAADGTLYVADSGNHCVRKVTPQGVVSTLIKNAGFNFPRGIAVDDAGVVYIADTYNNRVYQFAPLAE